MKTWLKLTKKIFCRIKAGINYIGAVEEIFIINHKK